MYLCEGLGSSAGLEESHSPRRMVFIAEFISVFFNALEGIEQPVKNVSWPGEIRCSYCVIGAHRMTQKHHEPFYSKFPLAVKIFTGSPGVLSGSDLLK